MKKQLFSLLFVVSLLLIVGCNRPNEAAQVVEDSVDLTAVVQTVYAQITETARVAALSATATSTNTPMPTLTFTPALPTSSPTEAMSDTPEPSPTEAPTATATNNMPCNRANLETKSIADGTEININQTFTQTFRLKNTGNCTWDQNYELRFVSGDLLNAGASIIMVPKGTIPTWGYANVDVYMKAPATPGTYTGYWMIKAANGEIFGTGPSAASWFWVEVKVIDPDA
ncbi:MAG: hypothetical protein ISR58_07200 [Anaerolineales bacterium]|nr:hypothetical protein [Chloroflexota bacterium]MBL6980962.1 hypothetical protein [Anaerolineales bacterium]